MKLFFVLQSLAAASLLSTTELKHQLLKKETDVKDQKVIEWTFADSKRPHLLQYFDRHGQLVLEKNDSDGNGIFEKQTEINTKTRSTEKSFDADQDGVIERRQIWQQEKDFILVSEFILNVNSKKLEKVSEKKVPREKALQADQLCTSPDGDNPYLKSIEAFKPLIGALLVTKKSDGWNQTNFGPRIHDNCIKKFGADFPALVQKSLREGISCLSLIDAPGSRENLTKIASLLENKSKPISFYCGPKAYMSDRPWLEDSLARATIPGDPGFPSVSFNPAKVQSNDEIQNTILHEVLHNCGHIHEEGQIEFMYSCPDCCAERPFDKNTPACQICGGNFSSTYSFDYQIALGGYQFSLAAKDILINIFSENVERRKDAPLAFLNSIQFSEEHSSMSAELYLYFTQQGIINGSQNYLYPPKQPASRVSPEVAAFGRAMSLSVDGKLKESILSLKDTAEKVSKLPIKNPLKQHYFTVINEAWKRTYDKLKTNPNDRALRAENDLYWNMRELFKY